MTDEYVAASRRRRCIVSGYCGDSWKEIAAVTWPAMETYCNQFGLSFTGYTRSGSFGRPSSWLKLVHIADCLTVADEVLWLDADVAVVDPTQNIFDEVPGESTQAMAFLDGSPPHWNSGVWLLRRASLPFLVEVAMQDYCVHHKWWEQKAVNDLIDAYSLPVHRLGEEWNHWTGSPQDISPRFRHACGPVDKLSLVKGWLETK